MAAPFYTLGQAGDSMTMEIRKATVADAKRLAELGARTFMETYLGLGHPVPGLIEHYAGEVFVPERIEGELRAAGVHYLVAEDGPGLVGYGKLVEEGAPPVVADGDGLWFLERIYIGESAQGMGAGRRLLSELERYAWEHGADGLWLTVWERNERAIGFYEAMDYVASGREAWGYEWEGERHADDDVVMVKRWSRAGGA